MTTPSTGAPLPTWEEARSHAEVLGEQGVDVRIYERGMSIEIFDTDGQWHDPADGTPARRGFYPDGTPMWISHYTDGKLVSKKSFPPPTGEA